MPDQTIRCKLPVASGGTGDRALEPCGELVRVETTVAHLYTSDGFTLLDDGVDTWAVVCDGGHTLHRGVTEDGDIVDLEGSWLGRVYAALFALGVIYPDVYEP